MNCTDLFKALADEIRLRILRAVSQAELSVAELVEILDLPQSTVSRHLKPLRETGLLDTRREGTSVFYRQGATLQATALADMLEQELKTLGHREADARLIELILNRRRQRSKEFFDQIAGRYQTLAEPGGGWVNLAAGLAAGFAGKVVADIGAGEGELALKLARFARQVIAVDQSPGMLKLIQEKAADQSIDIIKTTAGDLEQLPIADATCDAAFLSQALHHAARPAQAIRETARILKPGGHLILLDLVKHEQEWMREQWADIWLGFDPNEVKAWMTEAGLRLVNAPTLSRADESDIPVFLAVAQKSI
jgi:ArsR family transcriptional regulator